MSDQIEPTQALHRSDCAIYNEPPTACDCHLVDPGVPAPVDLPRAEHSPAAAAFIADRNAEALRGEDGGGSASGPSRLGWHVPDNLRWLAEQDGRPGYTPCGALTGVLLNQAADMMERLAEDKRNLAIELSIATGRQRVNIVDQDGNEVGHCLRSMKELTTEEAFRDEHGTVWTVPTAWAYFAACRARHAATGPTAQPPRKSAP